jgi:hypothetical protein
VALWNKRTRAPTEPQSQTLSPRHQRAQTACAGNEQLVHQLLPVQEQPGRPVLFACDDEAIRSAGARLGITQDPAGDLARVVALVFNVGKTAGVRGAYQVGHAFSKETRPRQVPSFVGLLGISVLAATRMTRDQQNSTHAYYTRLFEVLPQVGAAKAPEAFGYIPTLFQLFAEWLEQDESGRRGRLLLAPEDTRPPFVGACVFQTVFRERDRQLLSRFFSQRMRRSTGFDPLLLLRRWSGRHGLTGHAMEMLSDDRVADRVRAALASAYASWDGSVLLEEGGRVWPASLYVRPAPFSLRLSAGNTEPIYGRIGATAVGLEPFDEVVLEPALLDQLAAHGLTVGNPERPAGAARLPALGDTVAFELTDRGLQRSARPQAGEVWVLTRDGQLEHRLAAHRVNDRGALPRGWVLLRRVPIAALPGSISGEESIALPEEAPLLQLDYGLQIDSRAVLQGMPLRLVAADLEGDIFGVVVDGASVGVLGSNQTATLPTTTLGAHHLVVGDGVFHAEYHVEARGDRTGYDSLRFDLGSPRVFRAGASQITEPAGTIVSGALVDPSPDWAPPILVRRSGEHITIDHDGALRRHQRPSTPSWYRRVGLGGTSRWEIDDDDAVWLIYPKLAEARLWRDWSVAQLSSEAAAVVSALATGGVKLRARRGLTNAPERWDELRAAAETAGK